MGINSLRSRLVENLPICIGVCPCLLCKVFLNISKQILQIFFAEYCTFLPNKMLNVAIIDIISSKFGFCFTPRFYSLIMCFIEIAILLAILIVEYINQKFDIFTN